MKSCGIYKNPDKSNHRVNFTHAKQTVNERYKNNGRINTQNTFTVPSEKAAINRVKQAKSRNGKEQDVPQKPANSQKRDFFGIYAAKMCVGYQKSRDCSQHGNEKEISALPLYALSDITQLNSSYNLFAPI